METAIGVCAGIISIVLGVVGVLTSFFPPTSSGAKKAVVTGFTVLSLVALVTTVVDRQWSERSAGENKQQLETLVASSAQLSEQNQRLLESNAVLREKVSEAAAAPLELAMQRTLKNDVQRHLAGISAFLSEEQRKFNTDSIRIPATEYPDRYTQFRRTLSSAYQTRFHDETRRLLLRASQMKLIPTGTFVMDARFIEAGMIPYVDDLRKLVDKLPD